MHAGKTKAIGISNFSKEETEHLLKNSSIVPAVHQLELHPWLQQSSFAEYLKSKGIHVSQYSSLGNQNEIYDSGRKIGRLIDDPALTKIGQKYDKSSAQVALGELNRFIHFTRASSAFPYSLTHCFYSLGYQQRSLGPREI